MEAYVLMFQLLKEDPVLVMPVSDCAVAAAWIREARAWAERSRIDRVNWPAYTCGPARAPQIQAVRR